ncbi:hypothetical protein RJ55_07896 [Drechmeria coniospora]|nr:hypothetical protein RJ55_07896 [Drechmeria coniospora]
MMSTKVDNEELNAISPGPEVEEFAHALDACLVPGLSVAEKRARVLDLPRKYHEIATQRLIRKKSPQDGRNDADMDVDEQEPPVTDAKQREEISQLEMEVQTWDLFRRLLPLRYCESRPRNSHLFSVQPAKETKSQTLPEFIDTDPIFTERRAVLRWLQTNASSGPDIDELVRELQQNADRGDIIAHGWLHTRSKIKLRKSMTAWPHLLERQSTNVTSSHVGSGGVPLITHLDPDAPTRQDRKLEPQDEYFERAIWLGCFEHLRRGSSLASIREWCQERTEMWRAVSMSAMLLPAEGQESPEGAPPASIALWRRMCLSLARNGGTDNYERAVYGLLSGDVQSVEKVARSWDDVLFAHYNALLRSQADTFLLGHCPPEMASSLAQSFPSSEAVQLHGDGDTVERRLIASLECQSSTMEEALEPNKALQAALIANDIDRHLYEQALIMAEHANKDRPSRLLPRPSPSNLNIARRKFFGLDQHDGIRLVAHIYVVIALLRQLDELEGEHLASSSNALWRSGQENILAGYTDFLALAKTEELIPLYCSILQPPRQYDVLSWNMIDEQDPEKRILQLKLINRVGIDVLKFTETLAKLVYDDLDHRGSSVGVTETFTILLDGSSTARYGRGIQADFLGDDEAIISPKDERMIRSLEWLLQVQAAWPEVLRMGVQVYKYFFRNKRLLAARKLMERVQFDIIWQNVTDQQTPDWSLHETVDFWAQQLNQGGIVGVRPEEVALNVRIFRELECLAKALDGLETVGSLMELSAEAPSGDRKFWTGVGDAVKVLKERMQPLLGGWLLTGSDNSDEELAALRQTYLPETILAFISGLHYAGTGLSRDNLLDCMELASVIAERNSDLAQTFVKAGRMTELVEALAACSKALAVASTEKRAISSSNKKLREMGWSRNLWAIQQ